MNKHDLFTSFSDLDDDLVERAGEPVKKNRVWLRWTALAAAVALLVGVAFVLPGLLQGPVVPDDSQQTPVTPDEPAVTHPVVPGDGPQTPVTPDEPAVMHPVAPPPGIGYAGDPEPAPPPGGPTYPVELPTNPDSTETTAPGYTPILPTPAVPVEPTPAPPVEPSEPGAVNPTTPATPPSPVAPPMWLQFNELPVGRMLSEASLAGQRVKDLSEEELSAVLPGTLPGCAVSCSGKAYFTAAGDEQPYQVVLDIMLWCGTSVRVTILPGGMPLYGPSSVEDPEELILNDWYPSTFYAWKFKEEACTHLVAEVQKGDLLYTFTASPETDRVSITEAELTSLMTPFVQAAILPDLSVIHADSALLVGRQVLRLEDVQADQKLGAYMLMQFPDGMWDVTFTRYTSDDGSTTLTGSGYVGSASLTWRVRALEDRDKDRLVSAASMEKYDLSLYPIPRADSVPAELRQVVNDPIFSIDELTMEVVQRRVDAFSDAGDTAGPRLRFSVLYGTVLVEVNSKGVDPQWVCDQLKGLQ